MKAWTTAAVGLLACVLATGCGDDDPTAPDLAVERIEFSLLNRTGPTTGRVRITGHIRNIGTDYLSSPGQQQLQLWELVPGARERLVARRDFQNLPAQGRLSVSYDRTWNAATMREFPPDYRVVISLDPDIFIDGNPDNDDSNLRNNTHTESGRRINDLFDE